MSNKTILIADDERALVQVMQLRCRRLGLDTLGVHDGVTALEMIREERPDLVCLDVEMPPGNGLSVCRAMAAEEELAFVPTIILTGCADANTLKHCEETNAVYVLKSNKLWQSLEPIIRRLLSLGSDTPTSEGLHLEPSDVSCQGNATKTNVVQMP